MRFIQLRSAPAQKAGPLPASTTTRTSLSSSSCRKMLVSEAINASSKALRTAGRFSVTRATPPAFSTRTFITFGSLHPKYAEARLLDRRVERGRDRQAEQAPARGGIDHAVVPEAGARVIRMALVLVLVADGFLECFFGVRRFEIALHGRKHGGRLLAAHDGDAGVRPHPEQARRVGAAAHAVVAGAEGAADDHGEFRHARGCDRGHHLRAILGDAARHVLPADH